MLGKLIARDNLCTLGSCEGLVSCVIRLSSRYQALRSLENIHLFAETDVGSSSPSAERFLNFGVKHFLAFLRFFVLDFGRVAHNNLVGVLLFRK